MSVRLLDGGNTDWELQVSLAGMRPEDTLLVLLPPEYAALRVSELIDVIFTDDEQGCSLVKARLDLTENPDLPEIYSVMLDAFSQWRLGHCSLKLTRKLSKSTPRKSGSTGYNHVYQLFKKITNKKYQGQSRTRK